MEEKNVKQTITLKEKIFEFSVHLFLITLTILILIKFREPIYDFMWTDKYPFRPALENNVKETFNNLDKVLVPVGKMIVNGMMKIGEFLDKFPPHF